MPQQLVKFEQFFAAPRDKVFAFFADHEKFGLIWGGRFKRVKDGADPRDPNGLGSVRQVTTAGLTFEETIVAYQPSSLIEYTITRGGPIKNHKGHIEFREVQGGTKVEYTIAFDPRIPMTGGIFASILCASWHAGVNRAVEELARAA
jgi:uncharacterized protein YndB with AHSA1/START domain